MATKPPAILLERGILGLMLPRWGPWNPARELMGWRHVLGVIYFLLSQTQL